MSIEELAPFVGEWELEVDLPGAGGVRGHVGFEMVGDLLVQRTSVPVPEAPDSCCVAVRQDDGRYVQHYFDSRGVARLYEMTFDGRTWTLERTRPDLTPLEFQQRYVGTFSDDLSAITGEWQSSADGREWSRDFGLTYRRIVAAGEATRSALEEHWRASERGDTEAEHAIYAEDAILDYPQSGERFRGRTTIAAQRGGHPADRHFTVRRIVGSGDIWVSECIITYDGVPSYSVSVMEFAAGQVVHETQYFAATFGAPAWRTALAEPMPGRDIERA